MSANHCADCGRTNVYMYLCSAGTADTYWCAGCIGAHVSGWTKIEGCAPCDVCWHAHAPAELTLCQMCGGTGYRAPAESETDRCRCGSGRASAARWELADIDDHFVGDDLPSYLIARARRVALRRKWCEAALMTPTRDRCDDCSRAVPAVRLYHCDTTGSRGARRA